MVSSQAVEEQGSRENLNGHRYMATGKWPKNDQQKAPPIVFAFFCPFLLVFDPFLHFLARFRTFWAVCF